MKKNGALEGLRGLASLTVVLAHLGIFLPFVGHSIFPRAAEIKATYEVERVLNFPAFAPFYNGNFAVCVFFVLSGYVLIKGFMKSGDRSALVVGIVKRYPRLAIPSLASVLIAYLLYSSGALQNANTGSLSLGGWIGGLYSTPVSVSRVFYDGLIGAPIFGDVSDIYLNAPLWTIRIELWGAIGLFSAFYICGRHYAWLAVGLVGMMSFASLIPLAFLPFALGAALAQIEDPIIAHPRTATAASFAGLFFGAYQYSPTFSWLPDLWMHDFTLAGRHYILSPAAAYYDLGAFLLVGGIIGSRSAASLLARPFFQMLGRASFGVYLLHWPIILSFSIWAVRSLYEAGVSYPSAVGMGVAATLLLVVPLGLLFHRFIDMPNVAAANWLTGRLLTIARSPGIKRAGSTV